MATNYYPGNDDYSSPGTREIAAGFNQFRYTQTGATDPVSDGRYLSDFELGGDEQPPGYDRHIIK